MCVDTVEEGWKVDGGGSQDAKSQRISFPLETGLDFGNTIPPVVELEQSLRRN